MDKEKIIQETVDYVRRTLADAEGGHDWWHIYRVWQLAKHIAKTENVDGFVVELGALLHDIADFKFNAGDEEAGSRKTAEFLEHIAVDKDTIERVKKIVQNISFMGEKNEQAYTSPELSVVQDADRLDTMGAIGIARTINYGGSKGRKIYDPEIKPITGMDKERYTKESLNCESTSINHFYEKLLLLKDRMNTDTGKAIAEHRHKYMEDFLQEFYQEWDGKI